MRVPNLNKRVKLVSSTYTSDGAGGGTVNEPSVSVWAAISTVRPSERHDTSSTITTTQYKVRVRARGDTVINSAKYVKYRNRKMQVIGLDSEGFSDNYVTLICEDNLSV